MSLDVFGRSVDSHANIKGSRGPPGLGFKLTSDNQFDLENKRLCNVGEPVDKHDAVTLDALGYSMRIFKKEIDSLRKDIVKLDKDLQTLNKNLKTKEK